MTSPHARSRLARLASFVFVWAGTWSLACGTPTLPRPKVAAHTSADLEPVEYPPPPAKVESVPPRPEGNVVWVDGEWAYRNRKWRWRRGRWVALPPGKNLAFAPWTTVRDGEGRLFYAGGKWLDESGKAADDLPAVLEAPASRTLVVNEYGEDEDIGRDLREPRAGSRRRDAGAPGDRDRDRDRESDTRDDAGAP